MRKHGLAALVDVEDPGTTQAIRRGMQKALQGRSYGLPPPWNRKHQWTEKDVYRGVEDTLKHHAQWWKKIETKGMLAGGGGNLRMIPSKMKGMPDYIALIDGDFWAIECKKAQGRLKSEQKQTLEEIEAAGGVSVIIVTPRGLECCLMDSVLSKGDWLFPIY